MNILFVIRTGDIFPYFQSIIVALLARGHAVRYLADRKWTNLAKFEEILSRFKREHERFEYGFTLQRNDRWRNALFHARELLSYRQYLRGAQSAYYERRWLTYLPEMLQRFFRYRFFRALLATPPAAWVLRAIERIAPADQRIIADIRSYAPQVVVCNPTHARASSMDIEYLKAARLLGIPTVLPVAGWDNLTTKGVISVQPDRLLAWNDAQRGEAVTWHHTPKDRIRVIGATLFDEWFSYAKSSLTRAEFCARYGLREGNPFFLYLGSSKNIAEDEVWLVERLHAALQNARDPRLKRAQFLVRPHPANYLHYGKIRAEGIVVASPGTLPKSDAAMQSFYDILFHATAAIGVNSSSMLMAIIAGKPVMTVLTDAYRKTQEETQHFRQLMADDVLDCASNDAEFVAAAERLLNGNDTRRARRRTFVEKFLRPNGLDIVSGETAAREIIALAEQAQIL